LLGATSAVLELWACRVGVPEYLVPKKGAISEGRGYFPLPQKGVAIASEDEAEEASAAGGA
jgi:hypothetical protein